MRLALATGSRFFVLILGMLFLGMTVSGCFVDRSSRRDAGDTGGRGDAAVADSGSVDTAVIDSNSSMDSSDPFDSSMPDSAMMDADTPLFCDLADPDLVLCVRCEDEVVDESVNAVPFHSDGISFRVGPVGQACSLGATSRWSANDVSAFPSGGELTVELYASSDSFGVAERQGLIDLNGSWSIFVYPERMIRFDPDGSAEIFVALPPLPAVWTHLAMTVKDDVLTAYVNGIPVMMQRDAHTVNEGEPLAIGENAPDGENQFLGAIDEIRVFSRALSPGEIAASAARP